MDRTAELDLALDVDHLAVADPGVDRDPRRLRERLAAQREHRQAVHLPDLLAGGVDQHRAAQDRLLHEVAQAPRALPLRLDRRLDVFPRDRGGAGTARGEIGLGHQVDQILHVRRQALAVLDLARALLDDARHGGAVERRQRVAAGDRRDQTREKLVVLGRALDLVVEIDGTLNSSPKSGSYAYRR